MTPEEKKAKEKIRDAAKYQRNRAKRDAQNKVWRQKNKDKVSEMGKAYYAANKERVDAKNKLWVRNNRERQREFMRASIIKNKAVYRALTVKWQKDNPVMFAARQKESCVLRAARRGSTKASWFNAFDLDRLMISQNFHCVYCPASVKEDFHFDHRVPFILVGGGNKDNVQLLCPSCNYQKALRPHGEFLKIKTAELENAKLTMEDWSEA